MKFRIQVRANKFEGIYPVYEPFFKSLKELGGEWNDNVIVLPDNINMDAITKLVKPYADYIQLSLITE